MNDEMFRTFVLGNQEVIMRALAVLLADSDLEIAKLLNHFADTTKQLLELPEKKEGSPSCP